MNNGSNSDGKAGISRRQFVATGLLAVGGSSLLADSTTGRFTDTESAAGTVRVTGEPTLDYQIIDETQYGAQYEIGYQVEWVSDFQSIDIQVENLDQSYGETTSRTNQEGTVSYPSGGGSDGRANSEDTFRFTFRVYEGGSSDPEPDPVIEESVTDIPDGEGKQRGDLGDGNSTQFNWVMIEDNRNNSGARFDVYYELDARDDFEEVRVRFRDKTQAYGKRTETNGSNPNGVVNYSVGGTGGDTFDIIAEVIDENGLVVDSVAFEDEVADGEDPETYGDPVRSDSPQLDSFTLTDATDNGGVEYTLEYTTSKTDRFGGARVTFENEDNSWGTKTTDSEEPDGTVSYSQGGANGNSYTVTVEVLETRNGVMFPIDRGSLQDTAAATEGGSETKTWPEDAN